MIERIPLDIREAEESVLGAMVKSKKAVTKDFGMATHRGCCIEHSAINNINHPISDRMVKSNKANGDAGLRYAPL